MEEIKKIEVELVKSIDTFLSRHTSRNSCIETSTDCGNCYANEEQCKQCHKIWEVSYGVIVPTAYENVYKLLKWRHFENEEDAQKYYNSLEQEL